MFRLLLATLFCLITTSILAADIPYALQGSKKRLVSAEKADKKNAPFYCVECKEELVLRKGQIRIHHFAHSRDYNNGCNGGGPETFEHRRAKELIADHLADWKFIEQCSNGHDCNYYDFPPNHKGKIEYVFDRFKIDVMVIKDNRNICAIEVRNTHAVDDCKLAFFQEIKIPIFEVDANDVIDACQNSTFEVVLLSQQEDCLTCEEEEQKRNLRKCLLQKDNEEREQQERINRARQAEEQKIQQQKYAAAEKLLLIKDAESIVALNRVDLSVPFSMKEDAKRCGAHWDVGAKTWYVEADKIRKCSYWVVNSSSLIPLVEDLIQQKNSKLKRKAPVSLKEPKNKIIKKNKLITDFFEKSSGERSS